MKQHTLCHEFVEYIPEQLDEGVLYLALQFGAVTHLCCCGCGKEIVTPLSPTDWQLTYDGESISLEPSIGNWNLPCQSHYWIEHGKVVWAPQWSKEQIEDGRAYDQRRKAKHYVKKESADRHERTREITFWNKVRQWWRK